MDAIVAMTAKELRHGRDVAVAKATLLGLSAVCDKCYCCR